MQDQDATDSLAAKRRRLAAMLADTRRSTATRTGPVSFAQRRLWILDRLVPGSSAYNVPIVLRTRTAPDPGALGKALGEVIRRHEVLRTVFLSNDGVPVQRVCAPYEPVVDVCDVSAESDPREAADQRVKASIRQPFDLAKGPLLRVLLVRTGPEDHLICLTVHHVVCDGWSIVTLFRELDGLYGMVCDGAEAQLPPVEQQYIDFALWQRARLSGERAKELSAYWSESLDGAPGLLQLPLDASRPVHHRANGGIHEFAFPDRLREDILAFAARARTTPFSVVLSCFTALLQRYSAQDDIVVGVPAAGQTHSELQAMIGFFVNTLVMRMDLKGRPSLNEAVGRAREVALGAFAHQDMPFEKLVVELQPDRNPTVTPIFQVLFNFQSASNERLRLPNLDADLVPFDTGIVRFDLEFNAFVGEDGMGGSWLYNRDLFPAAAIARMSGLLERLLAAAVAQPDVPLSGLDLFEPADLDEFGRVGGTVQEHTRPAPGGTEAGPPVVRVHPPSSPDAERRVTGELLPAWRAMGSDPAVRRAVARRAGGFELPAGSVAVIAAAAGAVEPDEALWVLGAGAQLVLVEAGDGLLDAVLNVLAEGDVHTLSIAPGLLHQVIRAVERGEAVPGPRRVLVTGEALGLGLERRCLRALPDTEFWSVYRGAGIGDIASRRCDGDVPAGHDVAGTVCAGLAVRIRDADGQFAPIGAPGRVCVSTGPDAADEAGTGDLGRFREDGTLEVLGAEAAQTYVRQVRVPRGEIEETLAGHGSIGDARVVSSSDGNGEGPARLTACLTPAGEWGELPHLRDSVRAHAQRLLPGVLVPDAYLFLDELPLTDRGTADLAALRDTEGADEAEDERVAPRTDTERLLVEIWRSVLGVAEIGIHDNFFLLGGHSLLAIQLMSRVRRATRVDLPVSVLFRYRTIADLAARIATVSSGGGAGGNLVRMQSGSAPLPLVVVHPAGGGVFCYGPLATALTNRTVYAFEGRHPGASLTALAEHYLEQLPEEIADAPFALAGWSLGGVVAFEMARLHAANGGPAVPLTLIDSALFEGDPAAPDAEARLLDGYLQGVRADFDLALPASPDMALLPPRRVFADILERLGPDVPEVLDLEEMMRQYSVYRSHIRNLAGYRPEAPYPGRVHLLQASKSPAAAPAWRPYAPDLVVSRVEGDHYSIMRNPGLAAVLAELERVLADDHSPEGGPVR
ncbi:condensation domain-containing protein [Streptomyces sp. NPDC094144]|uniref:condensation domain-containing protein n=1 Tax=Streptomyces sp. NPDC094144 TaxID=3366056 RepID=UPI00381B5AC3